MESGRFDFGEPATSPVHDVTRVGPAGQPRIAESEFQSARHASATGAAAVLKTWTVRQSSYLQVVRNGGPISDHEAASVLKWQLSSVNSVRGALNDFAKEHGQPPMLIPDGFDLHIFTNELEQEVTTKRTRWRINPDYRGPR